MGEYESQMTAGAVYRRHPRRIERLRFAEAGIAAMFAAAPKSYVSLSFGKQSLCVAHLVYTVAPDTEMHFLASTETWLMFDYREVIDDFIGKWPINLRIHETDHLSGADSWKAARDAGDQDLQQMCDRSKWDGWFWGLAKDESPVRARTLQYHTSHHPTIYRYSDGKLRCCPVMEWDWMDIAAYVGEHNIRLLNIYRRYGLAMRSTARITKTMRNQAGIGWLRSTNSRGYRRLVNRHKELSE